MQSQSEKEMDLILKDATSFIGWELSNFLYDEKVLQIQLSGSGKWVWFTFRLKPGRPYFFLSQHRVFLIKDKKKPLLLFFRKHFKGEILKKVVRQESLGRVLRFYFSEDEKDYIEVVMIPGKVNVGLCKGEKKISAFKPKDIEPAPDNESFKDDSPRDPSFFLNLWETEKRKAGKKKIDHEEKIKKDLKKKEKGLKKMEDMLELLEESTWAEVGRWLKNNQNLENVPPSYLPYVDLTQSLAWNIETCFRKSKKDKLKIEGTAERVKVLKQEIRDLKNGSYLNNKRVKENLLKKAELKGKTYEIQNCRLFIGRSGNDNLKLLRKAKPWYYWLHIKDYPGAYGILERDKKSGELSSAIFEEAAQKVISQSLPKGASGKFECLYAECRYVRPIKGAKSGQVTYSHEKVIGIKVGE